MALEDGIAANLAGGTHHAFPDRGEGFCVLNDVAVAVRLLRFSGRARRILVLDLDVHQGNGTAAALSDEAGVTTFSLHAEKNYPWRKVPSTRDAGLPDGVGDDAYLRVLADELPGLLDRSRADLAFYLAGVDPTAGDRYGRLSLTREGLRRRDRLVLRSLRDAGMPVTLLLSGGYAATPEETASASPIRPV
jgi:acetoin utilization deacetylase AcuC-like enzyme